MWYYEITVYMLHVWLDFIFPYFNWIALFMRKRKIIPSGLVVTFSNKMRIHMEKGSRTKPVKGNWTIKVFWSLVERRTEKTWKIIGALHVVVNGQIQPQESNGCNASNAKIGPMKVAQMKVFIMYVTYVKWSDNVFLLVLKDVLLFIFCNNRPHGM